jgi:hypothetical protein
MKHDDHVLSVEEMIVGELYTVKHNCLIYIPDKKFYTQKLTTANNLKMNFNKSPALLIKSLKSSHPFNDIKEYLFLWNNIMFVTNIEHVSRLKL